MSHRRRHRPTVGFFGVGVENGKTIANLGTIWRTAVNLGASFTFQIGDRYQRQASDTVAAYRRLPHYVYEDVEAWRRHLPYSCVPIGIELAAGASDLVSYVHPMSAAYLLGPEDGSLSKAAVGACAELLVIPTAGCLNQAIAAGIVLYDRAAKREAAALSA